MDRKRNAGAKQLRAVGQQKAVKKSEKQIIDAELMFRLETRMKTSTGQIPAYSPTIPHRCKRRFKCGTNFTGTVSLADFHSQFLVATSATTAQPYVDMWRLRKISVYARNNEADYAVQVQITPAGLDTSSNNLNSLVKEFVVESQSSAKARILTIVPGLNQPLGMWHRTSTVNSSGNQFAIGTSSNGGAIDGNTIFEFDFEYLLNFAGPQYGYSVTGLSGLTTGVLYASPIAGGLLTVLDVNTV